MPPVVRCSVLKKLLILVSCTVTPCVSTTLALAQHATVRSAGGAVHISAPRISRVPISSAPIMHGPIYTPRTWRAPFVGPLGTAGFRPPRRPIHPFPPVLIYESPILLGGPFWGGGGPFWGSNFCRSATCDLFSPWMLAYTTVSSPGPTNYVSQVYETPVYGYGEETLDLPQLFLKDGTTLNVTDYWLVDDQLHFTMIDEEGTKPVEHVIPFDALDLQTTVDANTRRGFRFMLRNEPVEQYFRDHPEGPPPMVTPHME